MNSSVIPGRREAENPESGNPSVGDYWIPGSLAEPVLGRREAPIRVLGTRNDGS